MIHVVTLFGTFVGWAMIGHVAAKHAIHWRRRRQIQTPEREQDRIARIARLEIACGIGVKYGEDALRDVGTKFASGERSLSEHDLQRFGGAIGRECWACGNEYKPHEHGDWYRRDRHPRSEFSDVRNPDRDPLDETLCPSCLANARAELDYGVPLESA